MSINIGKLVRKFANQSVSESAKFMNTANQKIIKQSDHYLVAFDVYMVQIKDRIDY